MIALSDAVLILASVAALGTGYAHWRNNIEHGQRPANNAQIRDQPVLGEVSATQSTSAALPDVTPNISAAQPLAAADTGADQPLTTAGIGAAQPLATSGATANQPSAASGAGVEQPLATSGSGAEQPLVATPALVSATNTNDIAERNNAQTSASPSTADAPAAASTPVTIDNETLNTRAESIDAPRYGNHIVQPGDTLSQIAEQHSTSVRILQQINNIDGSLIVVGQALSYPLTAN